MRKLFFIGVLFFGTQASAQTIYPALVEGESLANIGQVATFSTAGLSEDDELLFNGTTTGGDSFSAMLDKNDDVIWGLQAGDLWTDGSEISAIKSHKLLFNSSFLVTVDLIGTNPRRVFARVNPDKSITEAIDCATSLLPDCENLELSHDGTGVFLAELPDRAWRITDQGVDPVFDFIVGDQLPLQQGPLQAGSSCQNDGPVTGWTLDAAGGVAAVVYREFDGKIRPVVMRQLLDGSFEILSAVDETSRGEVKDRCATRLLAVDLSGAAYADLMNVNNEQRWRLTTPTIPGRHLDASEDLRGTVSAWFVQNDYQAGSLKDSLPRHGLGGHIAADISRSGFLLGYTDFLDRRSLSIAAEGHSVPVLTQHNPIAVRGEIWTLGAIEFDAKTAENWLGSVNSRESAAFTLIDGTSGRKALMRLNSGNDFAVTSSGDEDSLPTTTCESVQHIWDGRRACTLRRALELAALRPKTAMVGSTFVTIDQPLPVIITEVIIRKVGVREVISTEDSPVFSVDGGNIRLEHVKSDHAGTMISAINGATISMLGVRSRRFESLITSIDSGPVTLESTYGGSIDVQGDATLTPLLSLNNVHFKNIITNGNARIVESDANLEDSIDEDCVRLTGGADTTLSVRHVQLGMCDVGIRAEQANVHADGDLVFYGERGMIVGGAFSQSEGARVHTNTAGFGCDVTNPDGEFGCESFGIKFLPGPPTKLSNAGFFNPGPSIITMRELEVSDTEFSWVRGPAVYADLLDTEALKITGETSIKKVFAPVFQVANGNLELSGTFTFEDVASLADVGGNITVTGPIHLQGFAGERCATFDGAAQTLTPQDCSMPLIRSRATTGLNVISGLQASNNDRPIIEVNSETNFDNIAIENNTGTIIANTAGTIHFGPNIIIQDNIGDGIYSGRGALEFNNTAIIQRNTGAGVAALNGDVTFQSRSIIVQNGTAECALDAECVSAGIYAPLGRVAAVGIEVSDNHGDGIFAQSIELSDSTVCRNSGVQLVAPVQVLQGVDTCEPRATLEQYGVEGGCSSTNAGTGWWLMILALFWRRRPSF